MVPAKPTKIPKHNNPINYLLINDDLVTEILLRLPAKSLIRFKSVCKRWRSLISSDYFSHQHTRLRRHPKPQPSLILQHKNYDIASAFCWQPTSINGAIIPYTLSSHDQNYKILQSCNGLLLLIGNRRDPDLKAGSRFSRFMCRVYNPTTKLSTKINLPYIEEDDYLQAIGLAFDPSESPYYKVVCIICFSPSTYSKHYTYRGRGGSCGDAQYWNNSIFWWRSQVDYIYCYDIAKNEVKTLGFPHFKRVIGDGLGEVSDSHHLQELDGRLYHLTLAYNNTDLRVQESESLLLTIALWELLGTGDGDDDADWVLKQRDGGIACQSKGRCVRLMRDDSDGSLQMIYHQTGKMKMSAYNFLHKTFRDIQDSMPPPFHYPYHRINNFLKASQFQQTLALV